MAKKEIKVYLKAAVVSCRTRCQFHMQSFYVCIRIMWRISWSIRTQSPANLNCTETWTKRRFSQTAIRFSQFFSHLLLRRTFKWRPAGLLCCYLQDSRFLSWLHGLSESTALKGSTAPRIQNKYIINLSSFFLFTSALITLRQTMTKQWLLYFIPYNFFIP